jgi:hypothetical protein
MGLFRARRSARPKHRFVPQCERLENRWCPAASVKAVGHTLLVHGTNGADTIVISDDGMGDVSATITTPAGKVLSGSGTGITKINVDSLAGKDNVSYALSAALDQAETLNLHLGKGSDSVFLDYTAGISSGGDLKININGGKGSDQLTADFGPITSAKVALFANLGKGVDSVALNYDTITGSTVKTNVHTGAGSDTFTVNYNHDISDSKVNFLAALNKGGDSFTGTLGGNILGTSAVTIRVNGGHGNDTVTVNAAATNVDANAKLSFELNGGLGNDNVTLTDEGTINGKLNAVVHGGPGTDTVAQNLTVDAGSTGNIFGRVFGGRGNDDETFNVTDNSGGTLSKLNVDLYAILGHNTLHHTSNVKVVQKGNKGNTDDDGDNSN